MLFFLGIMNEDEAHAISFQLEIQYHLRLFNFYLKTETNNDNSTNASNQLLEGINGNKNNRDIYQCNEKHLHQLYRMKQKNVSSIE